MTAQTMGLRTRGWVLPLALFVLSCAGFLAVYVTAVLTQEGQTVENIALDGSTFVIDGGLLGLVSTPRLALATIAVTAIALLFRGTRAATRVLVMIAAANVLAQLLKNAILDRPDLLESAADNTFPSGHTVVFTSVFLSLVMALPSVLRPLAALLSAGVLGTVAFQLLAFGWHRASDVAGGVLLVTGLVALAHLLLPDRTRDSGLLLRLAQGPLARGLTSASGRRGPRLRGPSRGGHSRFDSHVGRALLAACLLAAIVGGIFALLVALNLTVSTTSNLLIASELLCVTVAVVAVVVTLVLQRAPRS
jgi:hypothetical protein